MSDVLDEVKTHLEAAAAAIEAELAKAAPLADLKNKINEAKDALEPTPPTVGEGPTEVPETEPGAPLGSEAQG